MFTDLIGFEVSDEVRKQRRTEARAEEAQKREAVQQQIETTWYYMDAKSQERVRKVLMRNPALTPFQVIMAMHQ
jgi:hypothetical protein